MRLIIFVFQKNSFYVIIELLYFYRPCHIQFLIFYLLLWLLFVFSFFLFFSFLFFFPFSRTFFVLYSSLSTTAIKGRKQSRTEVHRESENPLFIFMRGRNLFEIKRGVARFETSFLFLSDHRSTYSSVDTRSKHSVRMAMMHVTRLSLYSFLFFFLSLVGEKGNVTRALLSIKFATVFVPIQSN